MGTGAGADGAGRYCTACGGSLGADDRRCPQCHRPQRPERIPSERWVTVIAAGVGVTLFTLVLTGATPTLGTETRTVVGVLALAAWVGTAVGLSLDLRYVSARTEWHPTALLWRLGVTLPVFAGVVASVYLIQRWRGIRESTGRRVRPDPDPGAATPPPPPKAREGDSQERR